MYATIDTLQITKRLQSKGAKAELAEEFAEIMKEREVESIKNLATKNDLLLVEERITSKVTMRIGAMVVVAIGVITWLDKIIK